MKGGSGRAFSDNVIMGWVLLHFTLLLPDTTSRQLRRGREERAAAGMSCTVAVQTGQKTMSLRRVKADEMHD